MSNSVNDARGGFERDETGEVPRYKAIAEIAEAERLRASAHTRLEPGKPDDFEHGRDFIPGSIRPATSLFLRSEMLNTTLASFRLLDNWRGADDAEREIANLVDMLDLAGYRVRFIPRDSPESEAELRIVTDQTSVPEHVALHRLRTYARATRIRDNDPDDPREVLKIRKSAWLGVDIQAAERASPRAARETNLIVACSQLRSCRLNLEEIENAFSTGILTVDNMEHFLSEEATENDRARLERARSRISRVAIPDSIVLGRLFGTPNMTRLLSKLSIEGYERAFVQHDFFVAPAANTYYLAGTRPETVVAEEWKSKT